jgi:hypothetical protein
MILNRLIRTEMTAILYESRPIQLALRFCAFVFCNTFASPFVA